MQYPNVFSIVSQTWPSYTLWLKKSAATLLAVSSRRLIWLWLLSLMALPAGLANAEVFTLASGSVGEGDRISPARLYKGSACSGENVSPELHWRGAPEGTRSFALTMIEPDVLSGNSRWHWVLFNIPSDLTSLPEGAGDPKSGLIPEAIQSRTDYRGHGYTGACPPEGRDDQQYQFRIFALKVDMLPLDESSPAAKVLEQIEANTLAEAQLDVIYGR
ncbi:YbhB/YbcL family Raf kinase inhibitor-like protein [Microbulbifer pacificus]|uniref:YbhB/YbcL family Raf kinase inhibitor-like protein n=1 Tax=Microbulbifer pacificus TaxID=407164 RepID=UPI001F2BCF68|nr:YbhB/YbcL family Raf kinase inhibitor-like protein [Microbulbifer pacificus]